MMISLGVKDSQKGKICKALFAKRKGDSFIKKSCVTVNEQEMNKMIKNNDNIILSLFTVNMLQESFEIPNISNEKSKIALFKSKLKSQNAQSNKQYLLIYHQNNGIATPPKANYSIYAVDDEILNTELSLSGVLQENISFYTVDFFSLAAVSARIVPESHVMQIFADETILYIIFSHGEKLEYSRTVHIPMGASPADMTNFYYENINLTYLYIRQNSPNVEVKVLLTGKLFMNTALKEQVEAFIGAAISEVDPEKIIQNISLKDFHEYLIPIGNLLLGREFDFSSQIEKADRIVRKALIFANSSLILLTIAAFIFFISSINIFNNKSTEMQNRAQTLFNQENLLLNEIGNQNLMRYKSIVIDLIRKKDDSSLRFLKSIEDIIEFQKFSKITFEGSAAEAKVTLSLEEPQNYYISVEELSKKMAEQLDTVKKRGVNVNDKSLHTLKDLQNRINIIVTPKGAQ